MNENKVQTRDKYAKLLLNANRQRQLAAPQPKQEEEEVLPNPRNSRKRPFQSYDTATMEIQESSLKRIRCVQTFSIDYDDVEIISGGGFGDEDGNKREGVETSNTASSFNQTFLLPSVSFGPNVKPIEHDHQNSSTRSYKKDTSRLSYTIGCSRATTGIENNRPSSPVKRAPSIVTPDESQVLMQSPKWNLEQHSMAHFDPILDEPTTTQSTGLVGLKPKLSSKFQPSEYDNEPKEANKYTVPKLEPSSRAFPGNEKNFQLHGPFPEEMKPIIRVLLYLAQTSTDRDVVKKVFGIVQNCYDEHGREGAKVQKVTGAIFQSLVSQLGQKLDLASLLQKSDTFTSPELEAYIVSKEEVCMEPTEKSFVPTLLQLAVAYGYHRSKTNPEQMNDFEDFVCNGASDVICMTPIEKVRFWKSVVEALHTKIR